jgi:hypothetical protein
MRASDGPVCCAFLGDSWWLEAFLFGHAASVVMVAGAYVGLWWLAEGISTVRERDDTPVVFALACRDAIAE